MLQPLHRADLHGEITVRIADFQIPDCQDSRVQASRTWLNKQGGGGECALWRHSCHTKWHGMFESSMRNLKPPHLFHDGMGAQKLKTLKDFKNRLKKLKIYAKSLTSSTMVWAVGALPFWTALAYSWSASEKQPDIAREKGRVSYIYLCYIERYIYIYNYIHSIHMLHRGMMHKQMPKTRPFPVHLVSNRYENILYIKMNVP